jgi:hypothetical protein
VLLSVLLQPMLVYLPGARRLLGLERVDPLAWGWVAGGVAAAWLFADVYSRRMRRELPVTPGVSVS